MNNTVLAALVGFVTSIVAAVVAYWTTKRREREAEWRKEKLGYWKRTQRHANDDRDHQNVTHMDLLSISWQ